MKTDDSLVITAPEEPFLCVCRDGVPNAHHCTFKAAGIGLCLSN